MHTAVSKAITEEQDFLPAHQPQLFPFPTVDVTFHRLEQDVQIKLSVAAKEEVGGGGSAVVVMGGWVDGCEHVIGKKRREIVSAKCHAT